MNVRDKVKEIRNNNAAATLQNIADEVGVSRERVRQILKKEGLSTTSTRSFTYSLSLQKPPYEEVGWITNNGHKFWVRFRPRIIIHPLSFNHKLLLNGKGKCFWVRTEDRVKWGCYSKNTFESLCGALLALVTGKVKFGDLHREIWEYYGFGCEHRFNVIRQLGWTSEQVLKEIETDGIKSLEVCKEADNLPPKELEDYFHKMGRS